MLTGAAFFFVARNKALSAAGASSPPCGEGRSGGEPFNASRWSQRARQPCEKTAPVYASCRDDVGGKMLRATIIALVVAQGGQAWAQVPLVAEQVFVADPADTTANTFGVVGLSGRSVAGLAALGEAANGKPQVQILGCRFDVELQRENTTLSRIQPIFSKKLTSIASAAPPSAGYGVLLNPQPVGIADPVTSIACAKDFHYVVFLYRQGASSRTAAIEALVFEFKQGSEAAFEAEQFYATSDKASVQTRDAVRAARGFYRVVFRSGADLAALDQQQRELLRGMMWVAPKLLGIPIP